MLLRWKNIGYNILLLGVKNELNAYTDKYIVTDAYSKPTFVVRP